MDGLLALTTFAAASVEWVEALTLVLAAGLTVGWRPASRGALAGLGVLILLIALLSLILGVLSGLKVLIQIVVGVILILLGLRWLGKAVLRQAGRIPFRDEERAFALEQQRLVGNRQAVQEAQAMSFQGVLLEGLEVVLIVVAFAGGSERGLASAALGALLALVVVVALGWLSHRPLSRIPENALKYGVGILLTSFGTFWLGEGLGVRWPGSDLWLLALAAILTLASFAQTSWLKRGAR